MPQEENTAPSAAEEAVAEAAAGRSPFSRRGLLGAAVGTAAVGGVAVGVALTGKGSLDGQDKLKGATAAGTEPSTAAAKPGKTREYWIQADSFVRNTVPNGHDGMMGVDYSADQTTYHAVGYRAYTE